MSILRGITLADVICFFRGHDNKGIETSGLYAGLPATFVDRKCKRCGLENSFVHVSVDFQIIVKEQEQK